MADANLGPLLRLWGLSTNQLPRRDASTDELASFMLGLLQEAVAFVDTIDDRSSDDSRWKSKGYKAYQGQAIGGSISDVVTVDLFERVVSGAVLGGIARPGVVAEVNPSKKTKPVKAPPPETWVCRRSRHANAAIPGSASWAEFRTCMKDHHAATERAMTPSVVDSHEALVWPAASAALPDAEEGGRRWSHFTLALQEMRHRIARPVLRDRIFPVLQMTCSAVGPENSRPQSSHSPRQSNLIQTDPSGNSTLIPEFLVVSVTVADFATEATPPEIAQLSRRSDIVVGSYVSVERFRLLPTILANSRGTGAVEWVMATASDARGMVPTWLQTPAVPSQIAKDVPLFLQWLQREGRKKKAEPLTGIAPTATKTSADTPTTTPPKNSPAATEEAGTAVAARP